jgi:hypothetical protein
VSGNDPRTVNRLAEELRQIIHYAATHSFTPPPRDMFPEPPVEQQAEGGDDR